MTRLFKKYDASGIRARERNRVGSFHGDLECDAARLFDLTPDAWMHISREWHTGTLDTVRQYHLREYARVQDMTIGMLI